MRQKSDQVCAWGGGARSGCQLYKIHDRPFAGGGRREVVVCVKNIEDGFIHQTMGTTQTDEECDLNYAIGAPIEKEVRYVLTNSLGFGGHNAALLLKKYEG